MSKKGQICSWPLVISGFVGGLLLLSSPSDAAPNKGSGVTLTSKAGADVWIQPSDAMIAKGCQYRLELKPERENNVDILDNFSGNNDWRTRGDHQTVAYQQVGQKPRDKFEYADYRILLKKCCGADVVSIDGLSFQFQKLSGVGQYVNYNYTLFTGSDNAKFTVTAKKKPWNLTAEIDIVKGASCP